MRRLALYATVALLLAAALPAAAHRGLRLQRAVEVAGR